jgi:hypothetical protein
LGGPASHANNDDECNAIFSIAVIKKKGKRKKKKKGSQIGPHTQRVIRVGPSNLHVHPKREIFTKRGNREP